jgi:hypothetical protein
VSGNVPTKAYIPLQFWFCRNPGLAIPIIALQYHEVMLKITFNPYTAVKNYSSGDNSEFNDFKVYGDYVYLDSIERKYFVQNSHEYLIEQLQINEEIVDSYFRLNFSHPVKELIFSATPVNTVTYYDPLSLTEYLQDAGGGTPHRSLPDGDYLIKFNGVDRFSPRNLRYFTRMQVYENHSGYGSVILPNTIGVYSFALYPENYEPSGTCNFSRINNAYMLIPSTISTGLDIYAINYNVLTVTSGMGGLAYSN